MSIVASVVKLVSLAPPTIVANLSPVYRQFWASVFVCNTMRMTARRAGPSAAATTCTLLLVSQLIDQSRQSYIAPYVAGDDCLSCSWYAT